MIYKKLDLNFNFLLIKLLFYNHVQSKILGFTTILLRDISKCSIDD